jgi:hypothetical protein
MIPPRNGLLTVNNDSMTVMQNDCASNDCWYVFTVSINGESMECQWSINEASMEHQWSVNGASMERQWSVNGASKILV